MAQILFNFLSPKALFSFTENKNTVTQFRQHTQFDILHFFAEQYLHGLYLWTLSLELVEVRLVQKQYLHV